MSRRFVYYNASGVSTFYPVNTFNLIAMWSLYKVNSSATDCVELREGSNTETFGFNGDMLDVTAINAWLSGISGNPSNVRVVRLFNQGLGGANYDVFQNTGGSQPYLDISNPSKPRLDFTRGNHFIDSISNNKITDGDSVFLASFETQNNSSVDGVIEERTGSSARIAIYSDTRVISNPPIIYNFAPTGSQEFRIDPLTQNAQEQNTVYAVRRDGNTSTAYRNGVLQGSGSGTDTFATATTSITIGKQTLGSLYFDGYFDSAIIHDDKLTTPDLITLSNYLQAQQ